MDDSAGNAQAIITRKMEKLQPKHTDPRLVCLNFKVPFRVRQQFKICAARSNLTMTELLLHLLTECLQSDAVAIKEEINKEIKK